MWPRGVLAIGLAGLVLGGCGGSDDGGPDSGAKSRGKKAAQSECDARGINSERGREGTCDEKGLRLTIVNRAHTLRLPGLKLKLLGTRTVRDMRPLLPEYLRTGLDTDGYVANGRWLLVKLRATNEGDAKISFPALSAGDQLALLLDEKQYSQANEDSFYNWNQYLGLKDIQPEQSETGYVAFDVPAKKAATLRNRGNVIVAVDPQEVERALKGDGEPKRAGMIRFWK